MPKCSSSGLGTWDRPSPLWISSPGQRQMGSGRVAAPLAAAPPPATSRRTLETQLSGGGVVEASPGYLTALNLIDPGHRDLHLWATRRLAHQGSDMTAPENPIGGGEGVTVELGSREASAGRAQAAQAAAGIDRWRCWRREQMERCGHPRRVNSKHERRHGTAPALSERFSRSRAGSRWSLCRRDSGWRWHLWSAG
jgi:hypothetical protein